jgi:hypothetical protein
MSAVAVCLRGFQYKPAWLRCKRTNIPGQVCAYSVNVIVTNFAFKWPYIVTNFLMIKPTRCTNFSNLFWNETLHVSDSSSVHHQELFTVHSAMVHPEPARKLSTNLYDI